MERWYFHQYREKKCEYGIEEAKANDRSEWLSLFGMGGEFE